MATIVTAMRRTLAPAFSSPPPPKHRAGSEEEGDDDDDDLGSGGELGSFSHAGSSCHISECTRGRGRFSTIFIALFFG